MKSHAYRARLYQSYVTTRLGTQQWELGAPGLRRDVVRNLAGDRDAPILDLGAGHGDLVAVLRDAGYRFVSAVDGSPEQVALAHQMGRPEVELGDVFDYLATRPAAFAAIVAVDVLEHFDKDEIIALLDAIWRSLQPGGRVVIRSCNASGPFAGRNSHSDFTHEIAFTDTSMTQLLRTTGFEEIRVLASEPAPHGLVSSARLVMWRLFAALLSVGLAAETGIVRGHILTQNLVAVAIRPIAAESAEA